MSFEGEKDLDVQFHYIIPRDCRKGGNCHKCCLLERNGLPGRAIVLLRAHDADLSDVRQLTGISLSLVIPEVCVFIHEDPADVRTPKVQHVPRARRWRCGDFGMNANSALMIQAYTGRKSEQRRMDGERDGTENKAQSLFVEERRNSVLIGGARMERRAEEAKEKI